ncbi:972_t:CDS:2 [Acaulospora colombiana]|uniref:972_t:CDS:1 n=1 Tax=Acaulospora colombiana TaxID=27376 RepID=A0ACA9M553_9GLOM|nr:972_t:CDS:2 [Acaulospora colombiana]
MGRQTANASGPITIVPTSFILFVYSVFCAAVAVLCWSSASGHLRRAVDEASPELRGKPVVTAFSGPTQATAIQRPQIPGRIFNSS